MRARGFRGLLLIVAAAAMVGWPSSAIADGLPILGVDASRTGLADSSGSRYVTLAAGRETVVARVAVRGGEIERSRVLPGRFTIPAVAYDASPSGLSADGRTLVLVRPRAAFPQRRTTFAVIDTSQLRTRRVVTLEGDFSFDAISPDGSTAYLIRYLSPRDPTRYEVRSFDLASGRLEPGPIVDPAEPDERMAGLPLSRAASPDGRWAYTLYDGSGHEPFVHALDTVARRAVCIDLPQLEGRRNLFLSALAVDPEGEELTVLSRRSGLPGSRPLLRVDTSSFQVQGPADAGAKPGGNLPWLWIGALSALLGIGFALLSSGRGGAGDRSPLERA